MDIQQVTTRIITLLQAGGSIDRSREAESTTGQALRDAKSAESTQDRDRLAIRLGRIDYSRSKLREVRDDLNIGQSKLTIMQTAKSAANSIRAELDEISRLTTAVSEGEVAESRLEDVQRMIDLGLARIEEIASSATYSGNRLLTGESVRIITDVRTREGFNLSLPEISVESLGLEGIDVVNEDIEKAVETVGGAFSSIDTAISRITSEELSMQREIESWMSELMNRFEEMSSREMLNAPAEMKWIEGDGEVDVTSRALGTIFASGTLDADVVSSLLK